MSNEVDTALEHADWWTGARASQGDMTVTDAMRVLAAEVRRLRELQAEDSDD